MLLPPWSKSIAPLRSAWFWAISAVLGGIGLLLMNWTQADDPCRNEVIRILSTSEQLVSRIGLVSKAKVRRTLKVYDAISVRDEFVPGYLRYEFIVQGAKARALVTVETGLKSCKPRIKVIDFF